MRISRFYLYVPMVLLSFLWVGCGSENDGLSSVDVASPQPGVTTKTIGSLGGVITYGNTALVILPGALSTSQDLQLGIPAALPTVALSENLMLVGNVYEAGPSEIGFSYPVSISIAYDNLDLSGDEANTLVLWRLDAAGGEPVPLDSLNLDVANQTMVGLTDHLSFFFLTIVAEGESDLSPPELIAPYNGMEGNQLHVTLRWEAGTEGVISHVQISDSPTFSTTFYGESGITGNLVGINGLEPNTTYYWRIRFREGINVGDWSEGWSFSTGNGSCPMTIEGSWELLSGEWTVPTFIGEYDYRAEIWGMLMISFSPDSYNMAGEEWVSLAFYNYYTGLITPDTTFSKVICEEAPYVIIGPTLQMDLSALIDPTYSPGFNSLEFVIQGDHLILIMLLEPAHWELGRIEFQRI